ncbi:ferritin-like domain-containing protein [Ureaplasma sp. ES3154-GEN]|uniref:ferritin-like domain-containing protein n=1 Tax=Ureaplasma sp. ES3154-GEN TaxID=2984844 RepID=UPI0021E78682|nr:ferritin-like domain-containing protein [Ureaplasma sp. ES3154-GEN]MCV3743715.1 ferritin-like domain-containing protein [Ureaplasma sp. ES3154-GEN]
MLKTKEVIGALNHHYNVNFSLGLEYAQLAHLVETKFKMPYAGKFLKTLSTDKTGVHKDKLLTYFTTADIPLTSNIQYTANNNEFDNALSVFEKVLANELAVRKELAEAATAALQAQDYETFEFLQWFIKDGVKDYSDVQAVIDLITESNNTALADHLISELEE